MPEPTLMQPFESNATNEFQSDFNHLGLQPIMDNTQALPLTENFPFIPDQSTYGHQIVGNLNPMLLDNSKPFGSIPDEGITSGIPFSGNNIFTPSGDQKEK